MNLTVEGDPHLPKGDPVELWVEWERGEEVIRHRAEELVWNAMTKRPMQQTHWIFTGGRLLRNQFTSQLFHNIIAVYRDPDSIFNHPLPGGTDDRTYRVNTDVVAPQSNTSENHPPDKYRMKRRGIDPTNSTISRWANRQIV